MTLAPSHIIFPLSRTTSLWQYMVHDSHLQSPTLATSRATSHFLVPAALGQYTNTRSTTLTGINYINELLLGSELHHYAMTLEDWTFLTCHRTANNRHHFVTFAFGHSTLEHSRHTLARIQYTPVLHSNTGYYCASIVLAYPPCTTPIGPPTSIIALSIASPSINHLRNTLLQWPSTRCSGAILHYQHYCQDARSTNPLHLLCF